MTVSSLTVIPASLAVVPAKAGTQARKAWEFRFD